MPRLVPLLALLLAGCADPAPPTEPIPARPKVAGTLKLTARGRTAAGPAEKVLEWKAAETAVIVCDMWDGHYCQAAARRVAVMAPRMNGVLSAARDNGVQIVHSPSGTIDLYADTPQRKRVQAAKPVTPPFPLAGWCYRDPDREPELPVDTSKSACDDPVTGAVVRKFARQHPALDVTGYDGVSDSGPEIFSFFKQEGIKHVAVMGVHTNMCVLGRPFGVRQLVKLGLDVVLVRDLTDAMYDPKQPPFVSHTRGTELVIEHVERYWCPSVLGDDLTRVVPGTAGP